MEQTTIDRETTVSENGILVNRSLSFNEEWIVGTIEVDSIGQDGVSVRVVDEFPDDIAIETANFKHGDEPESGEITAERASVTLPVENEPVAVDYGIKLSEPVADIEFGEPTISEVETIEQTSAGFAHTDGGEPRDDRWDDERTSSDAVKQAIRQVDPDSDESDQDSARQGDGEADESESDAASDVGLIDREDTASETATGKAEPNAPDSRRSIEARIDWLSSRIDEFAAYTAALEEFIDTHGTAPEFIERIEADLTTIEDRLDAVRADIDSVEDSHSDEISDLHGETDDLDQRLTEARTTFTTELEALREHVNGEVERIEDDVGSRTETVETKVESLDSRVSDVEALDARVSEIETDVDGLRESVHAVEDEMTTVSDDVAAMREELSELRSEVNDLAEFKASLAAVLESPAVESDGQETD